jgi:ABC-2 type transport system ATP-binding protein
LIANEPTRDLIRRAQDKAVVVEIDRDSTVADSACLRRIELIGERTLEITYRKDKVNAGEVLAALQREGSASSTSRPAIPTWRTCFLSLTREPA